MDLICKYNSQTPTFVEMPKSVCVVQGLKVTMPFQPYPAQLAMMNRILQALNRRANCLIESPTGSGKSLALLCAALAWQRSCEGRSPEEPKHRSLLDCDTFEDPYDEFNLEDFASPPSKKMEFVDTSFSKEMGTQDSVPVYEIEHYSVPRIYFCSRTHRQIAQLIRELRRSCYTDISMTVLASREYTCIHPHVSRLSDKNSECRKLVDGVENEYCSYYRNVKRGENERGRFLDRFYSCLHKKSFSGRVSSAEDLVWDIEDLTNVGHSCGLCPYFLCTDVLYRDAKVIFCPYNYLLDPLIRKSMNISLKGSVIVFDEAHNIEDVCRESISYSLVKEELLAVVAHLQLIAEQSSPELGDAAMVCILHFERLVEWMEKNAIDEEMTLQEPGYYTTVWRGTDVYVMLKAMGLEQSALHCLKNALDVFTGEKSSREDERKYKGEFVQAEMRILVPLEKLVYALIYLYRDKEDVLTSSSSDTYSYCLCLEKRAGTQHARFRGPLAEQSSKSTFKGTHFMESIHFWCMNPALAFKDVSRRARSIILASGTLCPMYTYAAELGVPFPIQLEAMHVLPPERMYVAAVGLGPNGKALRATYQEVDSFGFQDELARALLAICKVVPDGVLCFLPSYRLLEKLVKRWKDTGSLWEQITEQKLVLMEPRKGNELEGVLNKFHKAIAAPSAGNSQCTGALLLAVYRGKVAEGIDFADRQARAVVTVGIPYPNVKDLRIALKRQYNDSRLNDSRKIGKASFISGSQWFEVQAYRALNQALGRCLRHRNDWGALIMLDARSCQQQFRSGLSKWIRSNLRHCSDFNEMENYLSSFVERLQEK
uniref:DNA 5'-3' helicase n=1 Tax=Trichuris muris TaxID=70415 RepID=A0A5S6QV11_TRIMR